MKQTIKEKWIAALRSGEYKQGQNQLKKGDFFCCLGVLTDLYAKEKGLTWIPNWRKDSKEVYGDAAVPSFHVVAWAGLKEGNPTVVVPESIRGKTGFHCESLAQMNDRGCTFEQIADTIEQQL